MRANRPRAGKGEAAKDERKPATAAMIEQSRMVASSNQFQREPSSSTYSRVPRPMAMSTMPR